MAGDSSRESGKKGGRPPGTTTRPQIRDFVTAEEAQALVARIKERALTDDSMARFLFEHIFGKALQQLEVGGIDGEPLEANLSNKSDRKAIDSLRHLLKQQHA
jgi:hypothetical protein